MNQETQVGPTAAGVGITADGSTVIVANWETDSVTGVDVVNNVILAEYDLRPGIINPALSGVAVEGGAPAPGKTALPQATARWPPASSRPRPM